MKGTVMNVKRYDIDVPDGEFVERASGRVVLYDDFARVAEERDAMQRQLEMARTVEQVMGGWICGLAETFGEKPCEANPAMSIIQRGIDALRTERDAMRSIAELAIKALRDEGLTTTANELTFLLTTNAAALASKALPSHAARAVLGATDAPADHPMSKLIAEANAAIDAEGGA